MRSPMESPSHFKQDLPSTSVDGDPVVEPRWRPLEDVGAIVEDELEKLKSLDAPFLLLEARIRYRADTFFSDRESERLFDRLFGSGVVSRGRIQEWLTLDLPPSLKKFFKNYLDPREIPSRPYSTRVWCPVVFDVGTQLLDPPPSRLGLVHSFEVSARIHGDDPISTLPSPWPTRFEKLFSILRRQSRVGLWSRARRRLPVWRFLRSDGVDVETTTVSRDDMSLDLAAFCALILWFNGLETQGTIAASGEIEIDSAGGFQVKGVGNIREKALALRREAPWVRLFLVPTGQEVQVPPSISEHLRVREVGSLRDILHELNTECRRGTSNPAWFVGSVVAPIVAVASLVVGHRWLGDGTTPHPAVSDAGQSVVFVERPADGRIRIQKELRVLLAGDRTDPAMVHLQAVLAAKFDRWRVDFMRTSAGRPSYVADTPTVSVVYAPGLSDEALATANASLGLSFGPESAVSASGDAGITLHDVVAEVSLRPLVERLSVGGGLRVEYTLPRRSSVYSIEYRPTVLVFEPTEINRYDSNEQHLAAPSAPPTRAWFPIYGTMRIGLRLPDGGHDVIRVPQNMNYSPWSEFALFERPGMLQVPTIPFSAMTLDEAALRATFDLLLLTWTTAPESLPPQDGGSIRISLAPVLRWISHDADAHAIAARVPGEILGPLRHLWADLLVLAMGLQPEVCGRGPFPDLTGDEAALGVFERYCSSDSWGLVVDAYRRSGETPGYPCPECWARSAEADLGTDDFTGAVSDLERAALGVEASRMRALLVLTAAKVALASLAGDPRNSNAEATLLHVHLLLEEVRALGFTAQADFEEARVALIGSTLPDSDGGTVGTNVARALLQSVLTQRPRHALTQFLLAKLLMTGDASDRLRAVQLLEGLLSLRPGSSQAPQTLGDLDLVEYGVQPEHVLEDLIDLDRAQGNCADIVDLSRLRPWHDRQSDTGVQFEALAHALRVRSFWYLFPMVGAASSMSGSGIPNCP